MNHLIRPATTQSDTIVVTPASAGWQYLSFRVVALAAGQGYTIDTGGEEMALVPLQGSGLVQVGGRNFSFSAAASLLARRRSSMRRRARRSGSRHRRPSSLPSAARRRRANMACA
jgi:5-deoxy-D-glucuronate isomerase